MTSLDKLTRVLCFDMYTNTSTGHADNGGAGEGVVRLTANEMKSGTAMKNQYKHVDRWYGFTRDIQRW